mmetsp:Transcript_114661/g.331408  ORF Transcript_114661/g.331408 Transcript_114661/m.331408 type:complete len:107 (+) Transcript_114661:1550-1870(+)
MAGKWAPPRAGRVLAGSECCRRFGPVQPGWLSPTMCKKVFFTTKGDVVPSFGHHLSPPQDSASASAGIGESIDEAIHAGGGRAQAPGCSSSEGGVAPPHGAVIAGW